MPDPRVFIPVDLKKFMQLPDLNLNDQHPDMPLLSAYLKRFGYLDPGTADAQALDAPISDGLRKLQRQFGLPVTGTLDAATRQVMAADRCGMPDPGGPLDFATLCAWNRRNLTYAFGPLSAQVGNNVAMAAIRRAFATWSNCGVGLTFTEVATSASPDILIEWRQANDPDHSMVGGVIAHADFPPGCSVVVNNLPLPLHFDDQEHTWVDGAVANGFDIETVALHEIGHLLGLGHTTVASSVMFPTVSPNFTLRALQQDDLDGIRTLYTRTGWNGDWFPLPGQAVFDREKQQIAAVARSPDNLDLFVIGFDNHVWSTFWTPQTGWNGDWFPLPGQAVFDREKQQIAAVSRAPDNLDLFVIGFDNHVWTTFWTPQTGWNGDWFPLPGQAVFDREKQQIAAVSRSPDNLDLFVIGFDNHVWSTFWNPADRLEWRLVPAPGPGRVRPREAADRGGGAVAGQPRSVRDRLRQSRLEHVLVAADRLEWRLVPAPGPGRVRPREAADRGGGAVAEQPRSVRDRLRQSRLEHVLVPADRLEWRLVPAPGPGRVRPREAADRGGGAVAEQPRSVRDRLRQSRLEHVLEPADRLEWRLVPAPGPGRVRPREAADRGGGAGAEQPRSVRHRLRQSRLEHVLARIITC